MESHETGQDVPGGVAESRGRRMIHSPGGEQQQSRPPSNQPRESRSPLFLLEHLPTLPPHPVLSGRFCLHHILPWNPQTKYPVQVRSIWSLPSPWEVSKSNPTSWTLTLEDWRSLNRADRFLGKSGLQVKKKSYQKILEDCKIPSLIHILLF